MFQTFVRPAVVLTLGVVLTGGCTGAPGEDGSGQPLGPSAALSSDELKVRGTVGSLAGSCPDLRFILGSERIVTSAATEFQRIACLALREGSVIEVEGVRQADGAVLAREVELEDAAPAPPPVPPLPPGTAIEVEGLISGLEGVCPTLTFTIDVTRIRTTAATEFNRIPCAFLASGMDVEVDGTVGADGVLVAREVQPDEVTVTGSVGSPIAGTCPERSFGVDGQRVLTLVTTRFDDSSCTAIQIDMRVEVRGVRSPDGRLLATRVRPLEQRGENQEVRVRGALSALSGSCPNRSFMVAGERVATQAATRYDDVTCAGLAEGTVVEVRGFKQATGSLLADRLKRE